MTSVRRAFHTLKGSSRMVGLAAFGEAAWSCEQLYNRRLADSQAADGELIALTTDVLAYLGDWVEAIGARRDGGHNALDVQAAVDAFGMRGQHGALTLPGAPVRLQEQDIAERRGVVGIECCRTARRTRCRRSRNRCPCSTCCPNLPNAEDLELRPAASAIQPIDKLLTADEEVDFELDLGDAAALPAAGKDALQALASPEPESDAPSPDAVSSMMSLDIAEPPAEPVVPRGPVTLTLRGAAGRRTGAARSRARA